MTCSKGGLNMISKHLEKKVDLGLVEEVSGMRKPLTLEYYILEGASRRMDKPLEKVYGIEIVEKVRNIRIETKKIHDYSSDIKDAKAVIDLLASNAVTPVELIYVIDDMLGD